MGRKPRLTAFQQKDAIKWCNAGEATLEIAREKQHNFEIAECVVISDFEITGPS
jgi:hypothetical protein